jgi:tetratricopeptide (TPR) repeat protein
MSDKSHPSDRSESTPKKKRSKKALIISLVIVVLLIGGGVAAWFLATNKAPEPQNTSNKPTDTSNVLSESVQKTSATAAAQVTAGNTSAAIQTLGEAAASTTSNTDKAALYSQQSALYSQSGSNDQAVAVSKQAIDADPTNWKLYANLGFIYRSIGDKTNALNYFNQTLTVMKQQSDESNAAEIKGAISQLEAS